jgi:hypothetical protein
VEIISKTEGNTKIRHSLRTGALHTPLKKNVKKAGGAEGDKGRMK